MSTDIKEEEEETSIAVTSVVINIVCGSSLSLIDAL
jgi:hypothetical protein